MALRPTVYKGIKMRSRLEAAYAEQFDAFGWEWQYEPQCFATDEGQYLPDFRLQIYPDTWVRRHLYVEVKPLTSAAISKGWDDLPRWWRIIQANDPEAGAMLLCFSASSVGVIEWFAQSDLDTKPMMVTPARAGDDRFTIVRQLGHLNFCQRTTAAEPCESLYADRFAVAVRPEDPFALMLGDGH
jgi:hypothetical protein